MDGNSRPKPARRHANGGAGGGGSEVQPKPPGIVPKAKPKKAPGPGRRGVDQKLYRAEMLLTISREVAGIENLDAVLEKLVEITSREADCERATLFLHDDQTGELYSRVAQGEIRREIRLLNTSGIAGHVFTTGEGLIIDDAYSDVRFNRAIDQQTGFETKTVMCAPVRTVRGEVIGVAQALNKNGAG
jgi:adenylate cyclase